MDKLELYSVWWNLKYSLEELLKFRDVPYRRFVDSLDPIARGRISRDFIENQKMLMERSGTVLVAIWEDEYPSLLREIPKPPPFIFCIGDSSVIKERLFSIVGTRRSTEYGNRIAERFASELASEFVIVSGMAYGIDRHSHIGAMKTGKTIAVLASGVDVPSPKGNERLYHEIIEKGCVMSVYPLGSEAKRYRFPERNSLIAGLSVGTLVVQAPMKSGALITARYAADFGRDVFSVPGDIGKYVSEGTNFLIKSGAIPVTAPRDILEYYGLVTGGKESDPILDLIAQGHDTPEEIVEILGEDLGSVLARLTELELEGKVVNDSGKYRII